MRSLWPSAADVVDEQQVYAAALPWPQGRPLVRVNMICTLDGAIAFRGRGGPLAGPADKRVFFMLRGLADLVIVGAGTARTEGYGPVVLSPEVQDARAQRGQAPVPPLAVVSASGRLDWESRLFTGAAGGPRPVLVVPGPTAEELPPVAHEVAEVVPAGNEAGAVDIAAALSELGRRGYAHVLSEGGPGLNTSMVSAGMVDELCLTLSPKLAGAVGGPLVGGWLGSGAHWLERVGPPLDMDLDAAASAGTAPPLAQLAEMELTHVLEEDGYLFLRLHVSAPAGAATGR